MTAELAALRARVAELERDKDLLRSTVDVCVLESAILRSGLQDIWKANQDERAKAALLRALEVVKSVIHAPDPRDARIAYLENLVAGFEAGGRVSFGRCSPEVQHRLARIAELEAALREADARIRWHVKYQGTSDEDEAALAASIRALGDDDEPIELTLAEIDRRDRIIAEAAAVAARAQIVGWLRWSANRYYGEDIECEWPARRALLLAARDIETGAPSAGRPSGKARGDDHQRRVRQDGSTPCRPVRVMGRRHAGPAGAVEPDG